MDITDFKDIRGGKALEIVFKLLDVFNCRACSMVLTPDLSTCVSGHVLCSSCRTSTTKCPVCAKPSTDAQAPLFARILNQLPRECRNRSCPGVVMPGDDHQHFCGFKTTNCQLCPWVGSRRELPAHVSNSHTDVPTLSEGIIFGSWDDFNPNENGVRVWPIIIRGQFFWKFMRVELSKNVLVNEYFWVPNGKTLLRVHVKVEFKHQSGSNETSSSVILQPSSTWSQSSFDNALFNVKNFIDAKKVLRWTETYTVEDVETNPTPPSTPKKIPKSPVAGGVKVFPD